MKRSVYNVDIFRVFQIQKVESFVPPLEDSFKFECDLICHLVDIQNVLQVYGNINLRFPLSFTTVFKHVKPLNVDWRRWLYSNTL